MTTDEQLEICNRATPGPWWRTDPPWGEGTTVHAGPSDDPHCGEYVCDSDFFGEEATEKCENMAFIALARTALPAALRRVAELEAQVGELTRNGFVLSKQLQFAEEKLASIEAKAREWAKCWYGGSWRGNER